METKQFCLFCEFLFLLLIIRSINSTESNLLKFYENAAKDLVAKHLSGTKFCELILLPNEFTLKESFEATFITVKKEAYLNESDHVDPCCRSFHKCEAHKHVELNYTREKAYIRLCECEYSFQICLENLNSSLANQLGFTL